MESREIILETLKRIRATLPLRNFYLPDGIERTATQMSLQPYDRLLIMLDGTKNERMSLNGKLQIPSLECGDFYLLRKNIWEYGAFQTPHEFFCIIPRAGYLRLVHYHVKGQTGYSPWPDNDWFHTGALPESLELAFALLATLPNEPEFTHPLLRLIAGLALEEAEKETPSSRKSLQTFEKLRNYLEIHFGDPISREQIAEDFHLNPSYVSDLFKEFTGHSFHDYLTKCRISKAKHLLKNTNFSNKEIASMCGFSGEVYFIRRFREVAGAPPGKYRAIELERT